MSDLSELEKALSGVTVSIPIGRKLNVESLECSLVKIKWSPHDAKLWDPMLKIWLRFKSSYVKNRVSKSKRIYKKA